MSPKIGLFPPPVIAREAEPRRSPLAMRAPEPPPARDADTYDVSRATTFDAPRPGPHTDGRLSPRARHAELPSDLRSKMREAVWMALPEGQRTTLIGTYQELRRAGAWDDVTAVLGEKEKREAPVKLPGGLEADVAGNSGAVQLAVRDPDAFVKKLITANPELGVDGGVMGALHPGQISIRQAGPPTSLHLSVGPGNLVDAHIDRENPVEQPRRGQTQMSVLGGVRHWTREVLPEMIREHVGPAGVIIEPRIRGGARTEPGSGGPQWAPNGGEPAEMRLMVNLELRGIRTRKPAIERPAFEGSPSVPEGVMEKVNARLDRVKIAFPAPRGAEAGSVPEPRAMAAVLAAKIQEAVENKESRVHLDLGNTYAGLPGMQRQMLGEVGKLAKLVRAELERAGVDASAVSALTVTMGHVAGKPATEGGTIAL